MITIPLFLIHTYTRQEKSVCIIFAMHFQHSLVLWQVQMLTYAFTSKKIQSVHTCIERLTTEMCAYVKVYLNFLSYACIIESYNEMTSNYHCWRFLLPPPFLSLLFYVIIMREIVIGRPILFDGGLSLQVPIGAIWCIEQFNECWWWW